MQYYRVKQHTVHPSSKPVKFSLKPDVEHNIKDASSCCYSATQLQLCNSDVIWMHSAAHLTLAHIFLIMSKSWHRFAEHCLGDVGFSTTLQQLQMFTAQFRFDLSKLRSSSRNCLFSPANDLKKMFASNEQEFNGTEKS